MRTLCFLTLLLATLFAYEAKSQTTILLQPAATEGKDAVVYSGNPTNNYANIESNTAYTWTAGGNFVLKRFFLGFDLSAIPAEATITSARLSLFYNPTDAIEGFDVHTGENNLLIQRVTEGWEEGSLSWNNQPSTTTVNEVEVPASINGTQDYTNIDLTELVIDIQASLSGNNGFMIRMKDEQNFYKSVLFASSDHPNSSLHPILEVTYTTGNLTCTSVQPDATEGKDAVVYSGNPTNNYANIESNTAYTWTAGGNFVLKRFFLGFDFSAIPAEAIIASARLSLFYNPTDAIEGFDVHTGENNLLIQRVTEGWEEGSLNWNNQPATTTVNELEVPASINGTQDYTNIDLTELVIDMQGSSSGNNGFMIRMEDEQNFYKSVLFASSNHPNSALHPAMEVCWIAESTATENLDKEGFYYEVFPNPSAGNLIISLEVEQSGKCNISLVDMLGRAMYSDRLFLQEGINKLQFDWQDFPAGSYLLVIDQGGRPLVRKWVKN
jgi:hypothetical protein